MHRSRYALPALLIALCVGVAAAGCGRKGPLFLPGDAKTPPAADATRVGDTLKR
jgi:predicted small lipoprotein YifL